MSKLPPPPPSPSLHSPTNGHFPSPTFNPSTPKVRRKHSTSFLTEVTYNDDHLVPRRPPPHEVDTAWDRFKSRFGQARLPGSLGENVKGGKGKRGPRGGRYKGFTWPALVFLLLLGVLLYKIWQEFGGPDSEVKKAVKTSRSNKKKLEALSTGPPVKKKTFRVPAPSFFPTVEPLPVEHDEELIDYANHPLSPHRPPANQFFLHPKATFDTPVVALITSTNDPRPFILDTAASLSGQSLQNYMWIIVDDHSTNSDSLALLKVVTRDPRVVVLKNPGTKGLSEGRNVGLEYALNLPNPPKYFVSLDDDDIFEMTALEKTIWMMESNPEWDLGGFGYVKFGAANETVKMGLHSGATNFVQGNMVPNTAVYRASAVVESGCRYDTVDFHEGGEDWDFWMCLAENGHWGGTVPELLYWYRMNPDSFRAKRWGKTFARNGRGFEDLKTRIHHKRGNLSASNFPSFHPRRSVSLEHISWEAPYESNLGPADKSIMIVIPWLYVGGADIGALHMVEKYAEEGYRVTVLCTLYKQPDGIELRPQVLQWTHDVHVMPAFLRAHDFPRYFKHLIDSRGIREVIMSNSQLAYEMLPALSEQLPDVHFIDYLHNEAYDGWKSGGYPIYSTINQRYLARTLTCSSYLRDYVIERGHDPDRVGVVHLGIEIDEFIPASVEDRELAKDDLLSVEDSTIVITVVGRLDPQKRPLLLPQIVDQLLALLADTSLDFIVVVLGDGDLRAELQAAIQRHGVKDFFRILGTVSKPQDYLAATDIFLLPSMSEGISIAVAEAMAMQIPILTAHAGALPEQLGYGSDHVGGVLVQHTLTNDDADLYAAELLSLITDEAKRKKLGRNARKMVEKTFDWRATLQDLFPELEKAENLYKPLSDGLPHPAAYTAVQTVLLEAWPESDVFNHYGRF